MSVTRYLIAASALAISMSLFSGCASRSHAPTGVVPAEQWAAQIVRSRDDYKKMITVEGPVILKNDQRILLRVQHLDGSVGADLLHAYIIAKYGSEWRMYNSAYTIDGRQWPLEIIDRKVDYCGRYGCTFSEHLVIPFTRVYLQSHIDDGVDIKITGLRGEEVLYLPGNYILAFLEATMPVKFK